MKRALAFLPGHRLDVVYLLENIAKESQAILARQLHTSSNMSSRISVKNLRELLRLLQQLPKD